MKRGIKVAGFIFLFFMLFQIYSYYVHKEFENKGIITVATIYKVNNPSRSRPSLSYYFYTDDKEIKGIYGSNLLRSDSLEKLIGKRIPVIYLKLAPSYNSLLVDDSDYERYLKRMPDSMLWIKKYLED
jgi:hypothetical protein